MSLDARQFRWYIASVATFMVPGSIQMVLFPFLVAVVLAEPAERVGLAQTMSMLPSLLLVMIGGLVAERVDQRRLLMLIHCLAALPYLVLAALLWNGQLSYGLLLAYALVSGVLGAFSQPARDALVARIAGNQIQKAVTMTVGFTFALQLVGFALGSTASMIGPAPLLLLAGSIVLGGALVTARLQPAPPPEHGRAASWRDLTDGIGIVIASERMLPAFATIFSVGLFFGGAYMVLVPLFVRDVYAGTSGAIASAFGAFMFGTLFSTFALVRSGGIERQGRALMLALLTGALAIAPLSLAPPQWAFYVCIMLWGVSGGVAMTMSRTLMQEAAPEAYRARVMAIFSLGNMGGLPLGALLMGYAAAWLSPTGAVLVASGGIIVFVLIAALTTRLWSLQPMPLVAARA